MQIGMLTAPFSRQDLGSVVSFAARAEFDCLELCAAPDCAHFAPEQGREMARRMRDAGLEISSLAAYVDVTAADPTQRSANQAWLKGLISTCHEMEVDVLCCMAGLPPGGMSREETIKQIAAPFFAKLCPEAAQAGVKIALENWFATNIMNLAQWDLMFELVPDANFGLNFDPSHLLVQDIDYLAAVDRFAARLFHTHAKDTEVRRNERAYLGTKTDGWWRFVIPGYGEVNWGVYISRLRHAGYDGVLSIEHEDDSLSREAGFIKGLAYLRQFVWDAPEEAALAG